MSESSEVALLGPVQIKALAARLDIRPTKQLGQNFVHDANTVRRIVADSGVTSSDIALEVGPGLGSLTLALLDVVDRVVAVELDPKLAAELPATVRTHAPARADRLSVLHRDALRVEASELPAVPTALVANLPYNVSVPVLLHLLSELPSIATTLVMVQAEVADRLAAGPGSRVYGVPSVKARYFGTVRRAGAVGRNVFWPVPNVESGLVRIDRYPSCPWPDAKQSEVFAVIDAAFAQRRKTLRAALAGWAGSPTRAEALLVECGIAPSARGETLSIEHYVALAHARRAGA